jgi:hypothetical protein
VKAEQCEIFSSCHHRGYMHTLQHKIQDLLSATTIYTLLQEIEQ